MLVSRLKPYGELGAHLSIPTKKVFGRKPGGTIKYGSEDLDGCESDVAVAASLRSGFELLPVRLIDELPTYKDQNQQIRHIQEIQHNAKIASLNQRRIIQQM